MKQCDIYEFFDKLKNDPKLMEIFVKNPVDAMKNAGYSLTLEQEEQLITSLVKDLKAKVVPSEPREPEPTFGCGWNHSGCCK